jgi:hypothetical protein
VSEKQVLSLEQIEEQTALELPDRESLATLLVTCLVCVGKITLNLKIEDVDVAAQVCAQLNAIQVTVLGATVNAFDCKNNA